MPAVQVFLPAAAASAEWDCWQPSYCRNTQRHSKVKLSNRSASKSNTRRTPSIPKTLAPRERDLSRAKENFHPRRSLSTQASTLQTRRLFSQVSEQRHEECRPPPPKISYGVRGLA